MALDGLQSLLLRRFKGRHVHLVRYADDFIITGATCALLAEEVKPLVTQFLKERGLELSEEKTHIVHIDYGFDFLGFNLRRYQGKRRIKPAKTNIAAVKEKVQVPLNDGVSLPQGILIHRLNPIIRGWAYFYRHVVSKQIFCSTDHAIWRMTWNWATRRHPTKRARWIKDRYYVRKEGRDWVFTDGKAELFAMSSLPIRRHSPLRRGESNPYDPDWAVYFQRRSARQGSFRLELPD
jgi:RNA-directed DNA polymerase